MMGAQSELDVAITALTRAEASFRRKLTALDASLAAMRSARHDFALAYAQRLLPEFSRSSLERLDLTFPDFVDGAVRSSFRHNKPLFGLFKRPNSARDLELLQSNLGKYIEHSRDPRLTAQSASIAQLKAERSAITSIQEQVREILELLTKVREQELAVPEEASTYLDTIIASAKNKYRSRPTQESYESEAQLIPNHFVHGSVPVSHELDMWFEVLIGIPSDFRDLLHGALTGPAST